MYKRSKRVSAPVASSSVVRFEAADRAISLVGREYVGLVNAVTPAGAGTTSAFSTTFSLLRPTDTQLFSWMSAIASKFEKYKFMKLCFVYEPQCPTSTSGSVALWFDPDPTHSVPSDWNNMINTGVNTHGAPWTSHVLNVPLHLCAGRRQYYTKNEFADANAQGSVVVGFLPAPPTDPLEYYAGMFGFATQDIGPGVAGAAVNVPVGKVYLDYAISLQTQATNTWNLTSLIKGVPVGAEPAANSGSGLVKKTNFVGQWPPAPGTNGSVNNGDLDLFGNYSTSTAVPYASAGSQYFSTNTVTRVVTVIAPVDLQLFVGARANVNINSLTVRVIRGPNADVPAGTLYSVTSVPGNQGLAQSGFFYPIYLIPSTADTKISWLGQLRLYGGDQLSITIGSGGSMYITDCTLSFTPLPFGILQ